ncbi:hypothetical protein Runsl_4828 [Runella slithyformis DSM 19594]|uniref:Uncharacterized protein n=1 Tax=Runella slithyformis (strain ATCC 29530 / DSM 19594 / LMG 11500 / NCIMB 11436 / LSU 4) TaxID=761193 RepID=A0A7U3ZPU0_RUNSL|nr:hypothetical protein Runsl_4828 [Runella slithyformis DSM 19594]
MLKNTCVNAAMQGFSTDIRFYLLRPIILVVSSYKADERLFYFHASSTLFHRELLRNFGIVDRQFNRVFSLRQAGNRQVFDLCS